MDIVNHMTVVDALRESNGIEGVYDDASLVQAIKAWEYVMKYKKLTPAIVCKTHGILMKNQDLKNHEKGAFRTIPVYIGHHEATDYKKIERLVSAWCDSMNHTHKGAEEFSRILHVQYEGIHPFVDGNGRTGRIFMNWHRVRNGLEPLVIWEDDRFEYYQWFKDSPTLML